MKILIIFSLLCNFIMASDYTMLIYDMENRNMFQLNLDAMKKVIKAPVDVEVLMNVKKPQQLKIVQAKNKILINKYRNDKYFYNSTYFLIDKNITKYHLVKYSGYFLEDFKKYQPIGLFFEKNGMEYLIISINLDKLTKEEKFAVLSKIDKIIEYFAEKENIPAERIIIAGDLGLYSGYLDLLPSMPFHYLSKAKIVFNKNHITKNDNINILVHKSALKNSVAGAYPLKNLGIRSHLEYLRYLGNTYPLIANISVSNTLDEVKDRRKKIEEFYRTNSKQHLFR